MHLLLHPRVEHRAWYQSAARGKNHRRPWLGYFCMRTTDNVNASLIYRRTFIILAVSLWLPDHWHSSLLIYVDPTEYLHERRESQSHGHYPLPTSCGSLNLCIYEWLPHTHSLFQTHHNLAGCETRPLDSPVRDQEKAKPKPKQITNINTHTTIMLAESVYILSASKRSISVVWINCLRGDPLTRLHWCWRFVAIDRAGVDTI